MKKLTLLLVATALISGGAYAQKACCKKGGHCTKECAKDKKADASKAATNSNSNSNRAVKMDAPKKTS